MANERRLIDANALKQNIESRLKNGMIIGWLCSIVDDAKTVEAVEVVLCRDCRWFYRDDEFNRAWCGYNKCGANEVAVDGYCYRGERKDND
jgi:hypothetical protein